MLLRLFKGSESRLKNSKVCFFLLKCLQIKQGGAKVTLLWKPISATTRRKVCWTSQTEVVENNNIIK